MDDVFLLDAIDGTNREMLDGNLLPGAWELL
jgi:hypothetical protein